MISIPLIALLSLLVLASGTSLTDFIAQKIIQSPAYPQIKAKAAEFIAELGVDIQGVRLEGVFSGDLPPGVTRTFRPGTDGHFHFALFRKSEWRVEVMGGLEQYGLRALSDGKMELGGLWLLGVTVDAFEGRGVHSKMFAIRLDPQQEIKD